MVGIPYRRRRRRNAVYNHLCDVSARMLNRAAMSKEVVELKAKIAAKRKELDAAIKERDQSDRQWTAYAQSLIDKLFEMWKDGGKWIKKVQKDGQENCVVYDPIGMPRHLWGYLHDSYKMKAAMDRRGPNSIIQGFSSKIGFTAAYCMARENWQTFLSKGIDIGFVQVNSVHDSFSTECDFVAMPIGLYIMEHGLTTLVCRHYEEVYGCPTPIQHLYDIEVGYNEAELIGWKDQRFDSMAKTIKQLGEAKNQHPRLIKWALHNLEAIAEVRLEEIRNDAFDMTLESRTDWYLKNCKGLRHA